MALTSLMGTLTTAEVAAGGVVKFNVTQGTLSTDTNGTVSAGTTGVATTSDVASAVNSAVTAAVTNATGNQKLDISAGGTDSSVNLKTQKINGNWYRCCYNQCGWSKPSP